MTTHLDSQPPPETGSAIDRPRPRLAPLPQSASQLREKLVGEGLTIWAHGINTARITLQLSRLKLERCMLVARAINSSNEGREIPNTRPHTSAEFNPALGNNQKKRIFEINLGTVCLIDKIPLYAKVCNTTSPGTNRKEPGLVEKVLGHEWFLMRKV